MLKAAEDRRLQWEVVQKALELEFPPEEAERQLDTAVAWGRYERTTRGSFIWSQGHRGQ
jgi:NitT/TauT family transport system ATP-binding protein